MATVETGGQGPKPGAVSEHGLFVALLALRHGLALWWYGGIHARLHDNLDSDAVYSAVTGVFLRGGLDHGAFDVFLGGALDWTYFARASQPLGLIHALLPPVPAYWLTEVVVVCLAYGGMRALLTLTGVRGRDAALLSCLFAFGLSFSGQGLGLAGAPLVLYLTLRPQAPGAGAFVVLFLIGWNSVLVMHAAFLPLVVVAARMMLPAVAGWGRVARAQAVYLLGAVLGAVPLLANMWRGVAAHRDNWPVQTADNPLVAFVSSLVSNLLTQGSWYHATVTPALYSAVFLLAGFLALRGEAGHRLRRAAGVVLAFLLLAVALRAGLPFLQAQIEGPLRSVQLDRMGLFAAVLLVLLGALVLSGAPCGRAARWVRGAGILSLALFLLAHLGINPATLRAALPPEAREAARAAVAARDPGALAGPQVLGHPALKPAVLAGAVSTLSRHMRAQAYACIRTEVGTGRVLSAGPDPMIAPLNGIRAVDGYHNLYPAAYHAAFRPVIAAKLAASADLRAYYDDWGNRVGAFIDRVPEIPPDYAAAAVLGATHVIADRRLDGQELAEADPECLAGTGLRLYRIVSQAGR